MRKVSCGSYQGVHNTYSVKAWGRGNRTTNRDDPHRKIEALHLIKHTFEPGQTLNTERDNGMLVYANRLKLREDIGL